MDCALALQLVGISVIGNDSDLQIQDQAVETWMEPTHVPAMTDEYELTIIIAMFECQKQHHSCPSLVTL